MSDFRIDKITNRDGSAGTQIAGISTFSGTSGMQLPVGPTAYRGGRGRGVFVGGRTPTLLSSCEKIEIATTGDATDFGDLSAARAFFDGCSSSTRGLVGGGGEPGAVSTIEYFTVSSEGGANDFGDLTVARRYLGSANSSTRGLWLNSWGPKSNIIDYVTIATTGDASDFGDMTAKKQVDAGTSSPTRAVVAGGEGMAGNPAGSQASPWAENIIEYVTIATLGNGIDFGDLSYSAWGVGAMGNSTRGIFFGGNPGPYNTIEYITIATLGNASNFGDLVAASGYPNGVSNKTRGVVGGGEAPTATDVLQYVTIATTGDTIDFGDLITARAREATFSDSNGGLG